MNVSVKLNYDSEDTVGNVIAPRFPVLRSMGWWLLIGDDSSNSLLAVKKINGYQKKVGSLLPTSLIPLNSYFCRRYR